MSSLPRTALVIGSLMASISFAEAGGRSALETYPILATKVDKVVAESSAAATAAVPTPAPALQPPSKPDPDAKSNRRGQRSRLAEARTTKPAAAVEKAATPIVAPSAATAPATAVDQAALRPGQEPAAPTPTAVQSVAEAPKEAAAPTLAGLIAKHALANGIPFRLAQAVVRIESRGNARAAHAGALGLMQIKAGTARAEGFSGAAAGLLDAETNLHYGMKVLADAYRDAGGDVCRTLMKYQSGHLATHMTRANRTYCSKARAVMAGA